jgi:putative aldouronate transport system substrate-binding protein
MKNANRIENKNANRNIGALAAAFVALAVLLSALAGCGNSGRQGASATQQGAAASVAGTTTATDATDAANATEAAGGGAQAQPAPAETGLVAEAVGLSPDNPITFDVFLNFTWYPISKFEGIIPEEITKLTGVTLNPTVAVDNTQLGLLIASNELPDLVCSQELLSNLSTSDLCYDWGGLIDEYGISWDIPQVQIANSLSFTQEEGKFFSIFSHFASSEDWKTLLPYNVGAAMTGSLLYRHDLYEEMGSPKLENMEDLKQMLLAAHERYPQMTTLYFDNNWEYSYFRENFGFGQLQCKFVENTDGQWVTYIRHDSYIDYMLYLNELYRAGCLTADNYAMDNSGISAALEAGNGFAYSSCTQDTANQRTAALKSSVPDGVFYEAPVLGDASGYYESSLGFMCTFISKNCKNPEAALRFLQFLHSDEGAKLTQWGRKGIDYTTDENGVPVFSKEWSDATIDGTHDSTYNTWFYFGGSKILEAVARCAAFDSKQYPNYPTIRENYANKPWVQYAMPIEGTDEKIVYDKLFTQKTGQISAAEAKLLMSATREEFDANYAEMVRVAESIGMNELEEYMNERINEAKGVYGVD